MTLPAVIWDAPGGRALVGKIHRDLAAGLNCVCYAPKPLLGDSLVKSVSNSLYLAGLGRPAAASPPEGEPAGDLASILTPLWGLVSLEPLPQESQPPALSELFEAAARSDGLQVLILTGLESLPPKAQQAVAADLKSFSRLTQRQRSAGGEPSGLRILALASPRFPAVQADPLLSVHNWWAATGEADNQLVFNHLAEARQLDPARLAKFWWLKALCLGFCHDDFLLMDLVLEKEPATIEDLVKTLAGHPLAPVARRYREMVAQQPPPRALRLGERPPLPQSGLYRELWAEGLLLVQPGSLLHPLLMDEEALLKAVGAGQRQVFLPLVDYMQSYLLTTLEAFFDPYVWEQYEPGEKERSAVIAEMPALAFFIRDKLPANQRFTEPVKLAACHFASAWRRIRNSAAHNKAIGFEELQRAFNDYEAFYGIASSRLDDLR